MQCFKTKFHVNYKCEYYTEVSCKYANIGCEVKLKRKDMKTHEDDKIHLHLALGAVVELTDTMVKLNNTVVELKDTVDKLGDLIVEMKGQ